MMAGLIDYRRLIRTRHKLMPIALIESIVFDHPEGCCQIDCPSSPESKNGSDIAEMRYRKATQGAGSFFATAHKLSSNARGIRNSAARIPSVSM
jgi:hypothetical protein